MTHPENAWTATVRACRCLGWAAVLLLAGCGIQSTEVSDAGSAPTGVAAGMTLYFLGPHQELQPDLRDTGRLGTVSDAMALLLLGPGEADLSTGIAATDVTQVEATISDSTIQLRMPLAATEVSRRGIEQIVCTALAHHVQSGGSPTATVRILFTIAPPGADRPRTCPVIG